MKLIITEKPSVAKDIALAVGITEKNQGYYKNNEYFIVNAFGHLLKIDDKLTPETWSLENLPLFPETFIYTHPSKSHSDQFKIIKSLIKDSDEIIIATDAEREGELIARLILNHAGWNNWNKTFRFWTSEALSKEVVLKSLNNLKPSSDYDSVYYAALTRQHTDWLIGMNLTQAFTLQANFGTWSIGRVQTPVLKLIVDRDTLRLNFKPIKYFVLKAEFNYDNINYEGIYFNDKPVLVDSSEEIEEQQNSKLDKINSERIITDLFNTNIGIVTSVKKKNNSEQPPLLHSLSSLQREANEAYGFTAQQTLDLAQALYETHKCLSYPRTSSQVLAESSIDLVKEILVKIDKSIYVAQVDQAGKRVFNDAKLSDHHALIPLNKLPEGIEKDLEKLYSLVFRKFIGSFMPAYEFETTEIITQLKEHSFKTNGKINNQLGWKSLYTNEQKDVLPLLTLDSKVEKKKLDVIEKYTKPLPAYNESSLLQAMLKYNLGTEATRASIIEVVIKREYVVREKKNLIATTKGKELITQSAGLHYADHELTGYLEEQLEIIIKEKKGEIGYNKFISYIKNYIVEELAEIKKLDINFAGQASKKMISYAKQLSVQHKVKLDSTEFAYINTFIEKYKDAVADLGKCSCGKPITQRLKSYNCECGKLVWKEMFKKKISAKHAEGLMNGKILELKDCITNNGKRNLKVKLQADNKLEFIK